MVACRPRLFTLCGVCVRSLELDHTGTNHFHPLYVLFGGLDTCVRIGTLCRRFPLFFFSGSARYLSKEGGIHRDGGMHKWT